MRATHRQGSPRTAQSPSMLLLDGEYVRRTGPRRINMVVADESEHLPWESLCRPLAMEMG